MYGQLGRNLWRSQEAEIKNSHLVSGKMGPLQIQSLYTLSINILNIIFQIRLMYYTYLFFSYNSLLFPPFSIVQLLPLIILGFPPTCLFHCQITEIYKIMKPSCLLIQPIFFSPAVRLLRMHLICSVS